MRVYVWHGAGGGPAARADFCSRIKALKHRLHPKNNSAPLDALYARFRTEVSPAAKQAIARDVAAFERGVDTAAYSAVFRDVDQVVANVRAP